MLRRQYHIFHFLWCLSLFTHYSFHASQWMIVGDDFLNSSHIFFVFMGILGWSLTGLSLFFPYKKEIFLSGLLCTLLAKFSALPSVPNHIIILIILMLFMLVNLIVNLQISFPKKTCFLWFKSLIPFMRLSLILTYFLAALHKFNFGYFDTSESCSIIFISQLFPFFKFMGFESIIIYLSLFIEILIPILLGFRYTRLVGLILGLSFHLLLGFHPDTYIFGFSFLTLALYSFFLPVEIIHLVFNWVFKSKYSYLFTALNLIVGFFFSFWLWFFISLLFLSMILFCALNFKKENTYLDLDVFYKNPMNIFFIVLLIFNGLGAYVGLKTRTNFSMFSNINIYGEKNNHLFLPSRNTLGSYQTDLVQVIASDHQDLTYYINSDMRVTRFEFSKILQKIKKEEFMVLFKFNQQVYELKFPLTKETFPEEFEFMNEYNFLERKLLSFREVELNKRARCSW